MTDDHHRNIFDNLCDAILHLKDKQETYNFLKDLCTPQELQSLAERWRVCQLLSENKMSYREIHNKTGASVTTIGRVARFLRDEPYKGYLTILERIKKRGIP